MNNFSDMVILNDKEEIESGGLRDPLLRTCLIGKVLCALLELKERLSTIAQ
jgi:hypothetical protein